MNKFDKFNSYTNYLELEENMGDKKFDMLGIIFKMLFYWRWIMASVFVFLILGFLYLKTTQPIYEVKTTILIKDDKKGGASEMNGLKKLGLFDMKNNVDNEVEVLKTSDLTEQVIRNLSLYISYTEKGAFRENLVYGNSSPLKIWLDSTVVDTLKIPVKIIAELKTDGKISFSGIYNGNDFRISANLRDHFVRLPNFRLYFNVNNAAKLIANRKIKILIQSPLNAVKQYKLNVEVTSKTTSVVNINLSTNHLTKGKDFLSELVRVYNDEDMQDQNQMAANTGKFINERLTSLTRELGDVEGIVENYKQKEGLTDIELAAREYIQKSGDIDKRSLDIEIQLAIVSDEEKFLNTKENKEQLLPYGNILKDANLSSLIGDYNKLVLEKRRLLRVASSNNQSIIDLSDKIEGMYNTMKASIKDVKRGLLITRQDLQSKTHLNDGDIRQIPRQEREFTSIKRQQQVKEALYVFLLQKKEENFLSIVGVVPKAKLIDKASGSEAPVSPNSLMVIVVVLILGLALPAVVILIINAIRFKIFNKEELEALTVVPVLGEIPKSQQAGNIIIKEKSTNRFTEMFRLLRTNLLFVLNSPDKKVINIVSSVGGEGKTFISINMGISLAMLNKKVVIVGLDVRKPKLGEYIGLDNSTGITLYLLGSMTKDKLIRPSGVHPNLSIITAGPVPPNPNEMMAMEQLDELIKELREEYDYIILDTAPLGIVSDTFALNRFADVSLYIVRAEYTPKKNIEDATKLFLAEKVKNMYFILNASDYKKATYHYGYGQKYGYGYGNKYGYGYGYEEESVSKYV